MSADRYQYGMPVNDNADDDQEESKGKSPDKDSFVEFAAIQGAAAETIQRFGAAAKEHFVALTGKDNEAGKTFKRSLLDIFSYKKSDNPELRKTNIAQHRGFAAEVKSVTRKNADSIINKTGKTYIRTDDIAAEDSRFSVNDQLYDVVTKDSNGRVYMGTRAQMKFIGQDAADMLKQFADKKYSKYWDANVIMDIPDDRYDALMGVAGKPGLIDQEIEKLQKQIDTSLAKGNTELAEKEQSKIELYKKMKRNLRKSGLTDAEARFAVEHPYKSTAYDLAKIGHQAGKQQAFYGAAIRGSTSMVRNMVSCVKGEISPADAAVNLAKDTASGAAVSYATAFSGSVIKGAMQNSQSQYIRALSKTNLSATLVTSTLDVGKTISLYFKGELTPAECVETLGEHGVGQIGSAMFSTLGIATFAGSGNVMVTALAGMTGATFGYMAATSVYQELVTSLKEYELAKADRIRIEAECEEAIRMILQYRQEMDFYVEHYFSTNLRTFNEGFFSIDKAILENDVAGVISGNVQIQEMLGRTVQFKSQDEFDSLMSSDTSFKL